MTENKESVVLAGGRKVQAWLETQRADLAAAWVGDQRHVPAFLQAVVTDCIRQPKLMEAIYSAPETMKTALTVAANNGLVPGAAHKQLYLIPRRIKGRLEVTWIIGYHGLSAMAFNNRRVHSVEAFVVYEGEPFEWQPGKSIHHVARWDVERTDDKIVGAWAQAVLTDPSSHHVVDRPVSLALPLKEILRSRDRSEAYRNAEKSWDGNPPRLDSPWHVDFAAMVRKTPLRRLLSNGSVPMTNEMALAFGGEEEGERIVDANPDPTEPQPEKGPTFTDELMKRLGAEGPEQAP